MPPRLLFVALLAAAVALAGAGCSGSGDKAGQPRALQLTLHAPDGANDLTDVFVREADRRSLGTLKIVVEGERYSSRDPANERRLAAALRTGDAELTLLPSRAWESQGVTTFRALQAPFLVADEALLRRIVRGPIGAEILRGTDRIGVISLALLPDAPRRTLGRRPFTNLPSLRGARIRVVDSATTAAGLRALGAIPVTGYLSDEVGPALAAGRLDGTESSTGSILSNNYQAVAHYLPANVVLFLKTNTIAINGGAFGRLSSEQQGALREAASATLASALEAAPTDLGELESLCRMGVKLGQATPAEIAALRRAVDPVYRTLRRDGATASVISGIERVKAAHPAASPSLSARCNAPEPPTGGRTGAALPEGTYATTLTTDDFPGFAGNVADQIGTWTITLRDGRFREVLTPTRTNQLPNLGTYTARGNEVTFVFRSPSDMAGAREIVRWSYYRGELSFEIVAVADSAGAAFYTAHPWRRVG